MPWLEGWMDPQAKIESIYSIDLERAKPSAPSSCFCRYPLEPFLRLAPSSAKLGKGLQYLSCKVLSPPSLSMPDDLPLFLASVALFILYLVFSALTEMGTQLPWKK
jgi:hypothetical protein